MSALAPIARLRPGTQALYAAVLMAAVTTSGVLRSFHDQTPRLFPGAFGDILALGTFALLALHLLQRRDGRDLLGEAARPTGLRAEVAIPLLTVVLAEKWVSIDLLASAWNWIDSRLSDPRLADAAYRGWTALALMGVALAGTWVLRQSRHRLARTLEWNRLRRAVLLAGAGFAITATAAWALVLATGAWSPPYRGLPLAVGLAVGVSQAVRGAAEEFFYRGLIQTGLVRLLAETGMGEGRMPRLLAILTVSTGFAVEHYDPGMTPAGNLRPLLFVLVLSATLGTLLEVSRNLYLVIALHVQINLLVAGLWPLPLGPEGQPLLPAGTLVALLLAVVFAGVVLRHRRRGFA
ncbi:MAG: CPBP family intramembrane metalloprotease [Acidobacteriota bacterium]|nr:CPBP family intramembrane metalloprotease [Acidobacteriota bacterium]MDQ7087320.1 CPBP family intramembrane metalloprotease [Acidobacteriota bacterium]